MRLIFLGTSSGTPTRERNVSGLALKFDDGRTWILDCGEATQHRILESEIRPGTIERILISHLHGDHCYGLPGLLAAIGIHDRGREPVEVVGPRGLAAWVTATRRATYLGLSYPVRLTELDGPFRLADLGGLSVEVVPVEHRVPSFGFIIREAERRGRFDEVAAAALGLGHGPERGRLARGEIITLADGRQIRPEQVLGPPRPGRKLVYLGDCAAAEAAIVPGQGCDALIHECTYDGERSDQAAEWKHSTATMAGRIAARMQARRLVLTHFSSRYTVNGAQKGIADLVAEAAAACPGTEVVAADDRMVVPIPPRDA